MKSWIMKRALPLFLFIIMVLIMNGMPVYAVGSTERYIAVEECDHEEATYIQNEDSKTHQISCPTCGYSNEENCEYRNCIYDNETHTQICKFCGREKKEEHKFSLFSIEENYVVSFNAKCGTCKFQQELGTMTIHILEDLLYGETEGKIVTYETTMSGDITFQLDDEQVCLGQLDPMPNLPIGSHSLKIVVETAIGSAISVIYFNVVGAKLTEDMVMLSQTSTIYNGAEQKPIITVQDGEKILLEDTDYEVAYSTTDFTNVGTITITITGMKYNYTGKVEKDFVIKQSESELELKTDKTEYTYGDTITFMVTPIKIAESENKSRMNPTAAKTNTVDFYCGDTKLNDTEIRITENDLQIFTYHTSEKGIPIGNQEIKAVFGGSENLNATEETVMITLNPKPLTAVVDSTAKSAEKVYDKTTDFQTVALTLNGLVKDDTVTATADGTTDRVDVGNWALTPSSIMLFGIDKDYYMLAAEDVSGSVTIVKAVPVISVEVENTKGSYGDFFFLTVTVTNENGEKLDGTVTFRDNGTEIESALAVIDGMASFQWIGSELGIHRITAEFIPSVVWGGNYCSTSEEQEIEIGKATALEIIWPDTSKFTYVYGQKLSENILTGGSTEYGTFVWTDGSIIPTVKNHGYEVLFQPSESVKKNYEITELKQMVSVTVEQAETTLSVNATVADNTEEKKVILNIIVAGIEGAIIPTGIVQLTDITEGIEGRTISVDLDEKGTASYEWENRNNQVYTIQAVYKGDDNYKGSDTQIHFDIGKKYTVTIDGGIGVSGSGSYIEGETVTIDTGIKDGYYFNGWSGNVEFADKDKKTTTFVMPNKDVIITANWKEKKESNSDTEEKDSSDNSDSSSTEQNNIKKPTPLVSSIVTVPASQIADGSTTAMITTENIISAVLAAKDAAEKKGVNTEEITIEIHIMGSQNKDNIKVNLPRTVQDQIVNNQVSNFQLVVEKPDITITFDLAAVTKIRQQAGGDVQLTIEPIDISTLSEEAKIVLGNRPIFELKVTSINNLEDITDFGTGHIRVAIPYTLEKGESAGGVYAVCIDSEGKVIYLTNSSYDNNKKALTFVTDQFFVYGIAYQAPIIYQDMIGHFAEEDIQFVLTRGFLFGTGENTFHPDRGITLSELLYAFGVLTGAKPDQTGSYITWAEENGIIGKDITALSASDQMLTRQEVAIIVERFITADYARLTGGTLPKLHTETAFTDSTQIVTNAKEAVKTMQITGLMDGKDGEYFDPESYATRAEVSRILHRYIILSIYPESIRQGWIKNASGHWNYYQDGTKFIGWQTIDGVRYFFNPDGVMHEGWKQDPISKKWYYWTNKGITIGWKEINENKMGGRWYYFYVDGSLAIDTEIDGYKVGKDGAWEEK